MTHRSRVDEIDPRREFSEQGSCESILSAVVTPLGVCLYAIRVMGGSTCAVVEYPRDSDEAERLMYPWDGGLKVSVAVKREDG